MAGWVGTFLIEAGNRVHSHLGLSAPQIPSFFFLLLAAVQMRSVKVKFGLDFGLNPEVSKPLFQRKFQSVTDERLCAHRLATRLVRQSYASRCSVLGVCASLKWWREHVCATLPVYDALVSHWLAPGAFRNLASQCQSDRS